MQNTKKIKKDLKRLWEHISIRRRWQFGFLLLLMICASFAEVISIGAVLPFLGVLTSPDRIFNNPASKLFIQFLGINRSDQLLLPITITFAIAVIISGLMRLLLLFSTTRLSFRTGADLSYDIYLRTLYQPYAVHVSRNTSEVINGISNKTDSVIYSIILPALNLISCSVMLLSILIALLFIEPVIAITAFLGFGLIYVFIITITRDRLSTNSQLISRDSVKVIKYLQEGLGGIRDVLIDGTQFTYSKIFRKADQSLRRAQGNNLFISQSPRYGVEALGMLLIACLAYTLTRQTDGIAKAIPVLGALALGAQRLLPIMQQAYGSWSNIQGGQASLRDVLEFLDQPLPEYINQSNKVDLPFDKHINLNQLNFRYNSESQWIVENINLLIPKGSRVGFIGITGSGKSTLIDIIMGLLIPTSGTIEIDGQIITALNLRSWQEKIAHVPQSIFLSDSSIAENIAFGIDKEVINYDQVKDAATRAQIADVIEKLPNKYQTQVGERGVRLSGGQRQRIGIARAIYKQANILIFDEATSALDTETEQSVMKAIDDLSEDLTILIIAHRLSTLKNCNFIVELNDGSIKKISSYHDVINSV